MCASCPAPSWDYDPAPQHEWDDTPSGHCPSCKARFWGYDFAREGRDWFLVIDKCDCGQAVAWDGERVVVA